MSRANQEPPTRLGALQSILAGGGQALLDQASLLAGGVQRRLAEVGRGVEEQIATLGTALEDNLSDRIDEVISRLSVSLRRDLDTVAVRLDDIERRLAMLTSRDGTEQLLAPVQNLAQHAIESAAACQGRIEALGVRVEQLERRPAPEPADARDGVDPPTAERLRRAEECLVELGREVGTRVGEVSALAERVGRLESRVVEAARERVEADGSRAAETAALRDRLTRLEARLSELSREEVSRTVESAGLRERVFRLEQRAQAVEGARPGPSDDTDEPAEV